MTDYTPNLRLALPQFDKRQWQDDINNNIRVLDALWTKFFATSNLVGVWANATAYTATQLVVDSTAGTIWRCEVAHTSPTSGTFLASRTANPTYWANYTIGVRYKGAWSSGVAYANGDFVVANSSSFAVANIAHTAASAFALDYTAGKWEVLIDTTSAVSSINGSVSTALAAASSAVSAASAAATSASAATSAAASAALYAAAASAGVIWAGTGSGADDIVLTAASFVLTDGVTIAWRQVSDNTTTVRLNPNGTGLKNLLDATGENVATAGTLKADRWYTARYSSTSTKYEFQGPVTGLTLAQVQAAAVSM